MSRGSSIPGDALPGSDRRADNERAWSWQAATRAAATDGGPRQAGAAAGDGAATVPRSRRIRVAACLLALVVAGLGLWAGVLRHRWIPKRWGEVEPGRVYRSGQLHRALVEETLASHGIGVIVNLSTDDAGDPDQRAEIEAARALGIRRLSFPLDGSGRGVARRYVKALTAILEARRAGEAVLVHCAAGSYRTGVVVAWYRTLVQGIPPARAYDELLAYGVDEDDAAALVEYMNAHLRTVAEALRDRGFIAAVPDPLPYLPAPTPPPAD